jgi:hypothetical protein
MDNSKAFYLSAYIAFGTYFIVILLFIGYLSLGDVKKIDAYSKDTVLELNIVIEDKKSKIIKQIISHSMRIDDKISKKIVKKSTSISAKKRSDLKSLFANIKIKAHSIEKRQASNIQKSTVTSRFKSKFEKKSKSNNKLTKLLKKQKITYTNKRASDTKNEKDPYISKIYNLLYQRWNPLLLLDGLSTKVLLTIYSTGKLKYRVIQYSGDSTFDNQLVIFLEKQSILEFPHPNKNKVDIEVVFTSKG